MHIRVAAINSIVNVLGGNKLKLKRREYCPFSTLFAVCQEHYGMEHAQAHCTAGLFLNMSLALIKTRNNILYKFVKIALQCYIYIYTYIYIARSYNIYMYITYMTAVPEK